MLANSASYTRQDLVNIFGESALNNIPSDFHSRSVASDSRKLTGGELFTAIIGENFDAHKIVEQALEKASAAIVCKNWANENSGLCENAPLIIVEDTLKALGALAEYHRKRFNCQIIAIGGANGKTTTKDITAHLISQEFATHKTNGNFNNQLGVPFVVFQLDGSFQKAVIEIGTNEPGEIEILSKIVQPNIGLVTNIGREHLELLINLDGVENEETTLFRYLSETGGQAVVNCDDKRLKKYSNVTTNALTFSSTSDGDITGKIEFSAELNPILHISGLGMNFTAKMQTVGLASAYNALAAVAVANAVGVSESGIKQGLESFVSDEPHGYARMALEKIGDMFLLNDCYNANPDSMKIALETLSKFSAGKRKIAVLGDMRELGAASFKEHCELLELAQEKAQAIFIVGDEMKAAFDETRPKNARHFTNKAELAKSLIDFIEPNDAILLKGSRGMQMEEIREKFIKK